MDTSIRVDSIEPASGRMPSEYTRFVASMTGIYTPTDWMTQLPATKTR